MHRHSTDLVSSFAFFKNVIHKKIHLLILDSFIHGLISDSVVFMHVKQENAQEGEGGSPLNGLCRYMQAQRVWFFSRFGLK